MSTENPSPKEAVHDCLISPLMDQIIAIAKEHRISMLACFSLGEEPEGHAREGEHIYCTTAIIHPEEPKASAPRLQGAASILRDGYAAFAITTRKT